MPELLRIRAIFDRLVECPVQQRQTLQETLCGSDPTLNREVSALLRVHDGDFLSKMCCVGEALTDEPTWTLPYELGNYLLLEKIGEGGHGSVFLAEQREPVQRRVALKILKPSAEASAVLQRFEIERQTLAMMAHPGIAHIWDAGITPDGSPFFAMELVDGIPVTDWCQHHQASVAVRLQLFAQICRAIQHSHHKGIIHRDLKPSNILVIAMEGQPVVKVIDFGIATTGKSVPAGTQPIGTPAYMSPEQANLQRAGSDTRSDLYSLGAVLYELLTGVTPFSSERLRSSTAQEICRILREEDPPKPSQRVQNLPKDTPLALPASLLRGDMDAIVMKALARDPEQRYATGVALADDVTAWLEQRPVQAHPRSYSYAARKFLCRHRLESALAAVALVLVIGSVALALRSAAQTREEAEFRRMQASRAETVSRMLTRLIETTNPVSTRPNGTIEEISVKNLLRDFDREFASTPGLEPAAEQMLRQTIGRSWHAQGSYDEAQQQFRKSLSLAISRFGENSPETASVRHDLGTVLQDRGHYHAARNELRLALPQRHGPDAITTKAVLADTSRSLGDLALARELAQEIVAFPSPDVRSLQRAADVLAELGELDAAVMAAQKALELARQIDGSTGARAFFPLYTLAAVRRQQALPEESERLANEAISLAEQRLGAAHPLTAFARSQAMLFSTATAQQIQHASDDLRTAVGGDHPRATDLLFQAVSQLLESGDDEAALTALFQALGVDRKQRDRGQFIRTSDFSPAVQQIIRSGRLADYQQVTRAAYERIKARRGPYHRLTQSLQMLLILNLQETRNYQEAESLCQDSLQRRIESFGPHHFRTIECCIHLQKLYWALKRFPEVQSLGLDIEKRIAASDADPSVLGDFLNLTASTLTHCQFPDDAIRALETATNLLRPVQAWSLLASSRSQLADIHFKHQRYPEALTAVQEAQSILDQHADPRASLYPTAIQLQARILQASGQPSQAKLILEKAVQALTSISAKPGILSPLTEMLAKLSGP